MGNSTGTLVAFVLEVQFHLEKGEHMERVASVNVNELIVTCELCGNVEHFNVTSEEDVQKTFHEFKCKNFCGQNFYSFITVGKLKRA